MSMVQISYEISIDTLASILRAPDILHDILYSKSKHVLAEFEDGRFDEDNGVFEHIGAVPEYEDDRYPHERQLNYAAFPGYSIRYLSDLEVAHIALHFRNSTVNDANDPTLQEWFNGYLEFYTNAAQRGSAILECIL